MAIFGIYLRFLGCKPKRNTKSSFLEFLKFLRGKNGFWKINIVSFSTRENVPIPDTKKELFSKKISGDIWRFLFGRIFRHHPKSLRGLVFLLSFFQCFGIEAKDVKLDVLDFKWRTYKKSGLEKTHLHVIGCGICGLRSFFGHHKFSTFWPLDDLDCELHLCFSRRYWMPWLCHNFTMHCC